MVPERVARGTAMEKLLQSVKRFRIEIARQRQTLFRYVAEHLALRLRTGFLRLRGWI